MAQVTGLTAEKMLELADANIVDGEVVDQNLILTTRGGAEIDAGMVIGPPGPEGPAADMATMAELTVAVWELEAKTLAQDNGLKSWHGDAFLLGMNRVASRTLDPAGNPRLGIYRDQDRDQGFVGIDDYQALASYKGAIHNGPTSGFVAGGGSAISPDKKWLVSLPVGAVSPRVYPIDSTGFISSTTLLPLAAAVSGTAVGPVTFSPDGKAIFIGLNGSPFIEARPFDTATGIIGPKWANPATLPSAQPGSIVVSPNSQYLVVGSNSLAAADAIKAWAINTTTGTFGAVTSPATAPANAGSGVLGLAITEAGDYVLANQDRNISAWTFNQATGAFGAGRIDAPSTAVNMLNQGPLHYANGKVIGRGTASPYIHGWNFSGGAFGAKWANPSVLPTSAISTQYCDLSSDGAGFLFWESSGQVHQAYPINPAGGFGVKFSPSGSPVVASGPQATLRFPFERSGDLVSLSPSVSGVLLFGDKAGTDQLTGVLETTTKVLPAAATTIYILDDAVLDAGVTRQYDISMDGGATWTNNVARGQMVNVPSGNQLRIRLTMTRAATGQTGSIYWFNCWAG